MNSLSIVEGAVVRSAGAPDASVLFLIHAFGENSFCYRRMAACGLDERFNLIAPDLWGFGATPRDAQVCTVADYGRAVARLIRACVRHRRVGLVAHSIASAIAVEAIGELRDQVSGLFSIEGNLTVHDAMFTGKAAQFDDPEIFKAHFLDEIWQMGMTSPALRHYHASAHVADALAMWHLGRDTLNISANNQLGEAFRATPNPSLYYWSKDTTPAPTQAWIAQSGIENQVYTGAGHWPMVEQPAQTARAIQHFFDAQT